MSDDRPRSDGLPYAWLEHRLAQMEERLSNHGGEMRQGFLDIRRDLAIISVHEVRLDAVAIELRDVKSDVKSVTASANKIAGAGAVISVLVAAIAGWFRR